MSRRPQSRIHPVWRRGARGVLVGLTSLTLVLSGGASLAAPQDEPDLTDAVEQVEPALAEATTPATDTTAPGATEEPDGTATDTAEPAPQDATEADGAEDGAADLPAAVAPADDAATDDAATDDAANDDAVDADDSVTPLLVPPGDPGPGEVKLIARAGGDRTGTGAGTSTATPLAGASFEFFRITSLPDDGPPTGTSVGTCTTDASGECGIFADLTGELDGSDAFYAVQTGAPAGWVAPSQWAPGPEGAYIFASGFITADASVDDRIVELPLAFNDSVTEPAWASVRPNNTAPPQCGIDVAMVGDLSNSVTESEALLEQHKEAAFDFIDALTGTPSSIALYTFASLAPAEGAGNSGYPLTSVATQAGAQELKTHIEGNSQPPAGGGGTNWDRGFHQVVESGETYDVVLFLTDGQPTFHRDRQGPGDVSTIAEVNEAILSANAVKATGAQVILVGIGPEAFLEGASIRIPLVSGPTEGTDFYRTNLEDLGATLQEIASANCAGTLTVVKEVAELDGDVVPGGAGWTFSTDTTDVTPASATTDDTSAVNFQVGYTGSDLTRPVTITETQQEGFELSPVDGQNAVCVNTLDGTVLPVTDAGALGFTVDVAAEDIVSCTVRNTVVPPDYADLTVTKTAVPTFDRDWDWDITKVAEEDYLEVPAGEDGTFTYDVTVTPDGPTDSGFQLAGTITVTNPNDVPFTGVGVADSVGAPPGGTCTVPGGTDVTVGAGASVTLPYTCTITDVTATTTGTNEVTATWDAAAYPGTSGSATATAAFDFDEAVVAETDRYVTVTDSELDLSTLPGGNTFDAADGEQVLTYDLTWPSTPGQCETFENTATIGNTPGLEIGPLAVTGSSTETVELCAGVDLEVEKNVVLSFDRTYLWEIDKEADETTVTVDPETGTATVDYTVSATPTGSEDGDWAMTGVVTVTNPNEWLAITADVTDTVDVGGGAVCVVAGGTAVEVAAGASVDLTYTCTFMTQPSYSGTNTATATWADTVPTPSTSAVGTAEIASGGWSQTPVNSSVLVIDDQTDPANPVELGTATWNAEGTPTVFTYSLEHEGVPGECVEYTNTAWIQQTEQSAEETVEVCSPNLELDKTAVSAHQQADGSWEVRYEIDVVNDSEYPGVYDLSDTIEYGEGITPTQAVWFPEDEPEAGGSWTGLPEDRTEVLATAVEIAPGETHTYVVMVTADVAAGVVGTDAGQCDDEDEADGGGFLNAATLTAAGQEDTDRACAEPVAPSVAKTAGNLTDNDDGTWDVSYTIDVTNGDADQSVTYDLRDELGFAEGIDILAAMVERDGTGYPGWDGVTQTEIATGVELPAGTTHTYSVVVRVDLSEVTGSAGDGVRECGEEAEAGNGLFNRAVITSGGDEYDDDACLPVPDLSWTLSKSSDPVSGSLVRPGDRIDYTVTATPTGDAAPTHLVVRDDVSRVLDHARGTGTIEVSTGTFEWDGDVLVWHIPELAGPATLTYSVVVDDGAWGVTLRNVVTGEGPPPPTCVDDCTTSHTTPPVAQLPDDDLPRTGSELLGAALLAVVLSLGGAALIRRREEA